MVRALAGPVGKLRTRQSNQGYVGSWFPTCDLTGHVYLHDHHPICAQECILLFVGVSGQRQHCIEAAEVTEAKNCS